VIHAFSCARAPGPRVHRTGTGLLRNPARHRSAGRATVACIAPSPYRHPGPLRCHAGRKSARSRRAVTRTPRDPGSPDPPEASGAHLGSDRMGSGRRPPCEGWRPRNVVGHVVGAVVGHVVGATEGHLPAFERARSGGSPSESLGFHVMAGTRFVLSG